MWRDYCSRLKERSGAGMGALKNDDILYDYVARSNPNIYSRSAKQVKDPQQVLFPGYLCATPAAEIEIDESTPSQTQVIWSPLFDGTEPKNSDTGSKCDTATLVHELPAGWRTAEQKMLEIGSRNGEFISSCSSDAEDESAAPTVWRSAQCLLHMKDITEPQGAVEQDPAAAAAIDESFLEYSGCDADGKDPLDRVTEKFLLVEDYEEKLKNYQSEISVEESRYQTCSGGDGSSVCSGLSSGIGRGKLNSRESYKEEVLLSEIGGGSGDSSSEVRSCSAAAAAAAAAVDDEIKSSPRGAAAAGARCKLLNPEGKKQVKSGDRKARRVLSNVVGSGLKEEKVAKEYARPRVWNSGTNRGEKTKKLAEQSPGIRVPETTSKELGSKKASSISSSRRPPWCLHGGKRGGGIHHHGAMSDHEVTSAGSTTNEEETRAAAAAAAAIPDQNAELISTLAEMNNRELRVLQCSAAIMRHNIGVLRHDVMGLQGCLEGRKSGYSWWTFFKDFVVAAGLVSGAFGLRTVIDMLKRTVRFGALNKITNKQEKMALAAFVLTVGARFSKQIWREQGIAGSKDLREELSRINERVALMSELAASDRVAAAAAESE